jgi:Ca2+-binding EF-hand superfamily protein
MDTKLVAALVVGVAAAGLGATVFMMGGKAGPAVAAAGASPPAPAPRGDGGQPMPPLASAGLLPEISDGPDRATSEDDWRARMDRFDPGQFEQLSREERRERARQMRAEWEARMDTNGDGEVDRDERLDAMLDSPMGQRILDRFDANGDGQLDAAEREAMRAQQEREAAERQRRMVEQYDTDGDGQLSRDERRAAREEQQQARQEQMREMTLEFDFDGDGELDADERATAWQTIRDRAEIDAFVRRFDSNRDGEITTADFNAFLAVYQTGNSRADVNGDRAVDTLDVTAFRDMMARAANRP